MSILYITSWNQSINTLVLMHETGHYFAKSNYETKIYPEYFF